ncbi:hypothetical protein QC763_608825 [Podospora pseudopauciseta]|uniref:Secreted protein n=1 Tax=Podospora pseudopauciseta TaxID=2093780 RepID=A0ABR0H612_9PEZI|nr:hypothetical protein QC763_608825 [Podospora pseudopauciseta]
MLTNLITFLCGSLLLSLTGLACADADPATNYTIVELQWDMPITPGDASNGTVTVTGTVQQAIAQMDALYPGWNERFQSQISPRADGPVVGAALDELESYNCNFGTSCIISYILTGIDYLRGLEGGTKPKNGPGPGNCGRVSCSHNAAIWWCNDNNAAKEITWGKIADGAQVIVDNCRSGSSLKDVKGQAFYKSKWNVIVRRDPC